MVNDIEIALAIDDNYVTQCATTIASILMNTKSKSISFHILNSGLSEYNKELLSSLKKIKTFNISFYKIASEDIKKLPLNRSWISVATYYRLLLPSILPNNVKKCIYLDCDIVCLDDIEQLWNYDISQYCLAAVEDEDGTHNYKRLKLSNGDFYFNAGVLVLNIAKIRETNFINRCIRYYTSNSSLIKMQDQDILNGIFDGECLKLPMRWNIGTPYYHNITPQCKHLNDSDKHDIYQNPGIVHFTGRCKPWLDSSFHPFKYAYWKYLSYTPLKKLYYIYLFKCLCSNIYRYQVYNRGKMKTYKIYILNIPIFSFEKTATHEKYKFFGFISYKLKCKKS